MLKTIRDFKRAKLALRVWDRLQEITAVSTPDGSGELAVAHRDAQSVYKSALRASMAESQLNAMRDSRDAWKGQASKLQRECDTLGASNTALRAKLEQAQFILRANGIKA